MGRHLERVAVQVRVRKGVGKVTTKPKKNPYRRAERALKITGSALKYAALGILVALFIAVGWIGGLGAWALLIPVGAAVGVAAVIGVIFVITVPIMIVAEKIAKRWRQKRGEWDAAHRRA